MNRRRARAWAGCAALLVAGTVTACSGDASTQADSPTASGSTTPSTAMPSESPTVEVPAPPKEGACYRLSLEDAARPTNEADPVPCSSHHTAITIHVGRLDTIVDGHSLGVDSDRVQQQLASTCPKELDRFVGGTSDARALSRFEAIWFSPTLEEYDDGAMWFRCDLVALGGPDELLRLPEDQRLRDVLDRPGALDTFGLCGTAEPGTKGFERVACARPHSWVAIDTIPLSGGKAYPGVDRVRAAGDDDCSDEVRARNDLTLKYRYGWEWPTLDQWAAGQHYGFCWAPNDLA